MAVFTGDLVSPGMFKDYLTAMNTVGAYHASGEGYVYEFGVNLETLNYLQTINLLDDEKLQITLEYMQTSTYFYCCFTILVVVWLNGNALVAINEVRAYCTLDLVSTRLL